MKLSLLVILFFIGSKTFSQKNLDFGNVKIDSLFCKDEDDLDSNNICNSKNLLEIRLSVQLIDLKNLRMDYDQTVLKYNGSDWNATKYVYKMQESESEHHLENYALNRTIRLKASGNFENIFSILKQNNIFTLPSQQEITCDSVWNGGRFYFLTFKAGDRFRSYSFFNPEIYKLKYQNFKEFVDYESIVSIFSSCLIEE